MKYLVIVAALMLPTPAMAEHLDVMDVKLKEGCSISSYLTIVKDVNNWAKAYGYQARIAIPTHGDNLETMMWIGTSANAQTYGKVWDLWKDSLRDPNSAPSKLQARLLGCHNGNLGRRIYDVP